MGFFGSLFGGDGADAAREAAGLTYGNQVNASKQLEGFGNLYADRSRENAQAFNPYVQAGGSALERLLQGLGLPGGDGSDFSAAYRNLPGYQAGLQTGGQAIDRSASARSGIQNGATLKALQRFGSDYEDQRSGNYMTRLAGLAGSGQNATGSQVNTIQQGLGGQLQAQTGAANMMMQGAGTTGQGIIAAQNSQDKGAQNAIDLGTKAIAMLMGMPPTSGGGGGGSSFGFGQGNGYYGGSPSNNPNLMPWG